MKLESGNRVATTAAETASRYKQLESGVASLKQNNQNSLTDRRKESAQKPQAKTSLEQRGQTLLGDGKRAPVKHTTDRTPEQ